MKFDIIEVFTRAAKIIWKHKVLWIFGILASCGRSSGGNSNSSSRNSQFTENQPPQEMLRQFSQVAEKMMSWFLQNPWIIYAAIAVFLVIWLLQIFITTVGQIGLVRGAYHAEMGAEKIKFGELFNESLRYFWRTIGLGIVVFLPIMVLLIGMIVALIFLSDKSSNPVDGGFGIFALVFGLCCCFLPFMVALGMFYTQAVRALILEDLGVFASLARGWDVFIKNIVGLFVVAVILFIINLIIGIIIAIPIFIVLLPLISSFVAGNINSWQPFILAGIFLLLYSPIAWFFSGVLTTYIETIWTLIYIRVTPRKAEAPVMIEANA
ncbi:MAG: hypothetical protein Q7T89_07395 [Anaerolineales bacterium]|nr:hypothetical protein [Anaerolineales bacterium]